MYHLSVIFMSSCLVVLLNKLPYLEISLRVFIKILGTAFKSIAMDTDLIIDIVYHRVIGYEYRPVT